MVEQTCPCKLTLTIDLLAAQALPLHPSTSVHIILTSHRRGPWASPHPTAQRGITHHDRVLHVPRTTCGLVVPDRERVSSWRRRCDCPHGRRIEHSGGIIHRHHRERQIKHAAENLHRRSRRRLHSTFMQCTNLRRPSSLLLSIPHLPAFNCSLCCGQRQNFRQQCLRIRLRAASISSRLRSAFLAMFSLDAVSACAAPSRRTLA